MTILLVGLTALVLLLVIGWFVFMGGVVVTSWFDAPYVPMSRDTVRRLVSVVLWKRSDTVVDLGSGDGRVVLAVAPYVGRAIGYERSWPLYLVSQWRARWGRSTAVFRRENFFTADLAAADVVVCYLVPQALAHLSQKLKQELRPGATIVSCGFPLPGDWQLVKTVPGPAATTLGTLYLYVREPALGRPESKSRQATVSLVG